MAKKKKDENEETLVEETSVEETSTEEAPLETAAADDSDVTVEASASEKQPEDVASEAVEADAIEAAAEEATPVEEPAIEPVEVEAAPAAEKPKKAPKAAAPKTKTPKKAVETTPAEAKKITKRAEKIGIVSSDKMMKTVTVRVDRLVKHPIYRKYVKKRKKFMAHDEMGSKIGDKVKIVETRPLSARKRWRVVEILHRAES